MKNKDFERQSKAQQNYNDQRQELKEIQPHTQNEYISQASNKILKQLKLLSLNNLLVIVIFSNNIQLMSDSNEKILFILEKVKQFLLSSYVKDSSKIGPQTIMLNRISFSKHTSPKNNYLADYLNDTSIQNSTARKFIQPLNNINMTQTGNIFFRDQKNIGTSPFSAQNARQRSNVSTTAATAHRFRDQANLMLPEEYRSTFKNKSQLRELNQTNYRPLTNMTQKSLISTKPENEFTIPLQESDFYHAVIESDKLIKSITKMQMKELKQNVHDQQLLNMLGLLFLLKYQNQPYINEIQAAINNEEIKLIMLKLNPEELQISQVNFVIQQLLNNFNIDFLRDSNNIEDLIVKFLYFKCLMGIGIQQHEYEISNANSYFQITDEKSVVFTKIQASNPPIKTPSSHTKRRLLDNGEKMMSEEVQEFPIVTVSIRASISPSQKEIINKDNQESLKPTIPQQNLPNKINSQAIHRRLKSQQRYTSQNKTPSSLIEQSRLFSQQTSNHRKRQSPQGRMGSYLQPKHLILTDMKVLQPISKIPPSIPVFNLHEVLPEDIYREHQDEVEIPDIDLYNYQHVTLANYLRDTEPLPIQSKFSYHEIKDKLKEVPNNNEELMNFIQKKDVNDQPTLVLMELANKMKQRRLEIYDKPVSSHKVQSNNPFKFDKPFRLSQIQK